MWIQTADCIVDERSEVAALAHRWETRLGRGGVAELVAGAVAEALVPRVGVMRTGSPASKTIKENPIWALIYMCLHCKSNMRVNCLVSSMFFNTLQRKAFGCLYLPKIFHCLPLLIRKGRENGCFAMNHLYPETCPFSTFLPVAPWKCTHSLSCQGRCPNICQQKLVLKSSNHRTRQFIIHIARRIYMVGKPRYSGVAHSWFDCREVGQIFLKFIKAHLAILVLVNDVHTDVKKFLAVGSGFSAIKILKSEASLPA